MTGEPNRAKWTDICIVILTVGIVAAAIMQWREMHNAGAQTDRIISAAQKIESDLEAANAQNLDALKKTLAQSQEATDASNKQSQKVLNANIAGSQLDERAWVVVRGIEGKPQLDQPWEINVMFTDTGKTPARNVRLSCYLDRQKSEEDIVFGKPQYGQSTLIAPGDQSYCSLNALDKATVSKVNQAVLDLLINKEVTIFARGSVTYDDVFGKSHWLTFCLSMHPDGSAWDSCKTHNDTGDGKPPN